MSAPIAPWVNLGPASAVAEHGDYLTGDIPGADGAAIPVVVQNFRGTPKAFRNVCSHRYALMQDQPSGRGLLRCPYHAWVYDADGVPTGIPFNDSDFQLDREACRRLALTPVGLRLEGGRVWVHADPAAMIETGELLPARWFTEPQSLADEIAAFRRQWRYVGTRLDLEAGPITRALLDTSLTVAPDLTGRDEAGRPLTVDTCGNLVFARADGGDSLSLAAFLGPVADHLARLSGQCDQPVAQDQVEFGANWKALVENTMDDFHGSTVHPDTIHPAVHPDWQTHLETERFGRHSRSSWLMSDTTADWWRRIDAKATLRRVHDQPRYDHCFVFPDLYVASFFGAMVIIHTLDPLAVDRTRLSWRTFLPVAQPDRPATAAFRRSLTTMLSQSARTVVLEDQPLCERVQQARAAATGPGILGRRERRIADFHHAWAQALGLDQPVRPADAPY